MPQQTRPTLNQYTRILLGKTDNEPQAVMRMLQKSLSAPSFPAFWRYWNPLFSYNLYYRVYQPSVRFLPRALALILTFVVSGAIHDIAATLVTLFGEERRVVLLFTPVFATWGLLVVIEEALDIEFDTAPNWLRGIIHLAHLIGVYYLVRFVLYGVIGLGT